MRLASQLLTSVKGVFYVTKAISLDCGNYKLDAITGGKVNSLSVVGGEN